MNTQPQGSIVTVGTFDGVHRGHLCLLSQLRRRAEALGLRPVVLALHPHPRAILRPGSEPPMLTDISTRCELIRKLGGIDDVQVLALTRADMGATGAEFVQALKEKYDAGALLMGFNNHIGSDRATAADLTATAGIPVMEATPCADADVSSTAVRRAIAEGGVEEARCLLGRPYRYRGIVAHGKELGRTIGFPTANIEPATQQLLPGPGVYAVDVLLPEGVRRGIANIGHRPTVDIPGAPQTFEVHILDFDGDLYGRTVEVDFLAFLRHEERFPSLDALRVQLAADAAAARAL